MTDIRSAPSLPIDTKQSFAILADLHANLEAVTAVCTWLDRREVSQVLVLGDLVGYGACPEEVVRVVRDRRWHCVQGNHEAMLFGGGQGDAKVSVKNSARRALAWTRARLSDESLAFLGGLPRIARIEGKGWAVHGSLVDPTYCHAYIYEFSVELNATRLRELRPEAGSIVFYGHTHWPAMYEIDDVGLRSLETPIRAMRPRADRLYLVNPGSVGFPRDGDPRAALLLYDAADGTIQANRIEYDVEAAAERIRSAGYDGEIAERVKLGR